MGWNEAWRVLGCAVVGAGIGVVIVLTGGALAAPCGAAIWTVTAVEGTTALTAAGCSALAVAGATSAATVHISETLRPTIPYLPREKE